MKQLHEYDTPETSPYRGVWATSWSSGISIYEHARSLEQRLAACRDALQNLSKLNLCGRAYEEIEQTLTLTAPK